MNPDMAFMREAYNEALKSVDPSTQNGAVLVKDGEIIGRGHNHIPERFDPTPEMYADRDLKLKRVAHAEVDAIADAAKHGRRTAGSTLYVGWGICVPCAKSLVEFGVEELVCHAVPEHQNQNPEWLRSIDAAFDYLRDAGVRCRWLHGPVGCTIRLSRVPTAC
jgi:dCMP deaminase